MTDSATVDSVYEAMLGETAESADDSRSDEGAVSPDEALFNASSQVKAIAHDGGRPDFATVAPWINEWARSDPEGLFAMYQDIKSSGGNRWLADYIEEHLAKVWGRSDPEAALQVAETLTNWRDRESFTRNILTGMSQHSPVEALEVLHQRPELDIGTRRDVAYDIYQNWAMKAPADAFAHASAHANLADRSTIMTNLARMYGESNPMQAYEWAAALEDPYEQRHALVYTIRGITRIDYDLARETLDKVQSETGDAVLVNMIKFQILEELSLYNQQEAYSFMQEVGPSAGRTQAIERLSAHWGRREPLQTLAWSLALSDEKERNSAVVGTLMSWSEVDAAATLDYIVDKPELDIPVAVTAEVVAEWSKTEPVKALEFFLENVSDLPEELADTKTTLFSNLLLHDPDVARKLMEDNASTISQDPVWEPAIIQWIAHAPHQISEVLDFVEDAQLGATLTGAIATGWTAVDPAGASQWINSLDDGDAKENAIAAMLAQTAYTYPEESFEMAFQVKNNRARLGFLQDMVSEVARSNPDQAYEMLKHPALSDAERSHLESELQIYHPRR
ncbi:MAG: hypothetical protein EA353_01435 [Puniceicoccaceae bacterium]|nr:MAG: hypothetical protein EA353_01435 [Puniceicoccaceae bacterium]